MTNTDFRTAMREEFRLTISDLTDILLDRYFEQCCDDVLNELLKSEDISSTPIIDSYSVSATASDTLTLDVTKKCLWIDDNIQYIVSGSSNTIKKAGIDTVIAGKDVKSLLSGKPCYFAKLDYQAIQFDAVLTAGATVSFRAVFEADAISKIKDTGNFDSIIYERGKDLVSKYLNLYRRGK